MDYPDGRSYIGEWEEGLQVRCALVRTRNCHERREKHQRANSEGSGSGLRWCFLCTVTLAVGVPASAAFVANNLRPTRGANGGRGTGRDGLVVERRRRVRDLRREERGELLGGRPHLRQGPHRREGQESQVRRLRAAARRPAAPTAPPPTPNELNARTSASASGERKD